jgi:hypothetical protein
MKRAFLPLPVCLLLTAALLLQGCLCGLLDPGTGFYNPPVPVNPPVTRSPSAPATAPSTLVPAAEGGALKVVPPAYTPPPAPPAMPPAVTRTFKTGKLTLGPATDLGAARIPPEGGSVSLEGGELNGLTLTVPPGAYPSTREFRMTYAPITASTFNHITPASHLITLENGGGYTDQLMTLRVPFQTPPGKFAMGFIYDAASGRLEGVPSVARDAQSITLATRHFSSVFLSIIDLFLLDADIDSGFRPGIDDWQFTNYGSYIAPGGHCSGQSQSAMWYYVTKPDGPDATLYRRYDNNGKSPPWPGIWEDDSWGYRLASVVQQDYERTNFSRLFMALRGLDDITTWREFAYSIKATGEPQLVSMESSQGGAHAMVVYEVKQGTLLVADPNYPGRNDRSIVFSNGAFTPYQSGDNADAIKAGRSKPYEGIGYWGKTTLVGWDKLPGRWQEFKAGTIGSAKPIIGDPFPNFLIAYRDATGQYRELKDGLVVSNPGLDLNTLNPSFKSQISVFRDGAWLSWDNQGAVALKQGENQLGVRVLGTLTVGGKAEDKYVDFRWFKVTYTPLQPELSLSPSAWSGDTSQRVTFIVTSKAPPARASYEWLVNGFSLMRGSDNSFIFVPPAAGTFTILVREYDEAAGKVTVTAQALATVKAATTATAPSDLLARLQKFNRFSAAFGQGKSTYEIYDAAKGTTSTTVSTIMGFDWDIPESYKYPLAITWSGATFSGSYTIDQPTYDYYGDVKGTVSADGKTLLTVTHNCTIISTGTNNRGEATRDERRVFITLQNLPIWDATFQKAFAPVTGSDIGKYIARLDDVSTYTVAGKLATRDTYKSTVWNATAGIGGKFEYSSGS